MIDFHILFLIAVAGAFIFVGLVWFFLAKTKHDRKEFEYRLEGLEKAYSDAVQLIAIVAIDKHGTPPEPVMPANDNFSEFEVES